MKKLFLLMLAILPFLAVGQTNLIGVPFGIPVADFESQIQSKTPELASIANAKKCNVSVNKNIPGDIQTVCFVIIELEYKATETNMGFAIIRSILNSKYGENTIRETMTAIHERGLFWRTPFGEIAICQISNTIQIRIFDYKSIEKEYVDLYKLL